jgi:hypothetical protein
MVVIYLASSIRLNSNRYARKHHSDLIALNTFGLLGWHSKPKAQAVGRTNKAANRLEGPAARRPFVC